MKAPPPPGAQGPLAGGGSAYLPSFCCQNPVPHLVVLPCLPSGHSDLGHRNLDGARGPMFEVA